MKILIINGAPRSGKDTFIRFLEEETSSVFAYSSIDWVKGVAPSLGWDGDKNKLGRNFLSELKDAATRYNDIPFKKILEKVNYAQIKGFDFFAVNIREPEEIKKLKSYCVALRISCHTVRIINPEAEKKAEDLNNTGDCGYMNYNYDYFVANNSTIEKFRRNSVYFLNQLSIKKKIA